MSIQEDKCSNKRDAIFASLTIIDDEPDVLVKGPIAQNYYSAIMSLAAALKPGASTLIR